MKACLFLFILSFFIQMSFAQKIADTCCVSTIRKVGFENAKLNSLSKEYKRLKHIQDKCCDKWNSDLHKIMSRLLLELGKKGTDTDLVIKTMGKPDSNGEDIPENVCRISKDEKLLIYTWRGYHDFIYFVYQHGKIIRSDWFMWGE
jgi:hypothetical protein